MPIIAKETKTDFEPVPTGMQQAVCAMVCDIGTHKGEYQGKETMRHQVIILWELEEKKKEGQWAGEPFYLSKFYTLSLGKDANLRKDLESWRGKPFTTEELQGFDIENLIGANCLLNVIEDKEKAKISAISPLVKGMPKIKQTMTEEPEWVDKFRAKSIERTGAGKSVSSAVGPASSPGNTPPPPSEDDLPF
jgi:hypothetical protein